MSIPVPLDQLADEVARWGPGYLLTVSDDQRAHLLALRPTVVHDGTVGGSGATYVLRFDGGGGRACRNAVARPNVSVVFPPAAHADGYSLVIDGDATVVGDLVDVRPTGALLHRPAPPAP